MKRVLQRISALLFASLLMFACSGSGTKERKLEQCGVWSLGERYSTTYSELRCFYTYTVKDESFILTSYRNKKQTGMSKRVIDSREVDGVVYALCESKLHNPEGKAMYTYYECFTGSYYYNIGREADGFYIEDYLSMDDAIALIADPDAPKGVKLTDTEWNAHYRTDACNLDIVIRPNDKGAMCRSLSSSYQARDESGETYYISSIGDEIVYTDGTHSVQIRQANRAGSTAPDYLTVAECKAILALLNAE